MYTEIISKLVFVNFPLILSGDFSVRNAGNKPDTSRMRLVIALEPLKMFKKKFNILLKGPLLRKILL